MTVPGKLEAALDADRTLSAWAHTYTDLTMRTQGHAMEITAGRQDRTSQLTAARMDMPLDNSDGLLTPGNPSATGFYPGWDEGALVRYRVEDQTPYLLMDGDSTVTTADKATLDITGDQFGAIQWRGPCPTPRGPIPAADVTERFVLFVTKYNPGQASYLTYSTDGFAAVSWSPDGTDGSLLTAISSVRIPQPMAGTNTLAWWLDVNNGASGWTVRFYWARLSIAALITRIAAGDLSVRLGTDQTDTGVTSVHAGTADLLLGPDTIGSDLYGGAWGQIEAFQLRSGDHTGTVVANPDFTAQTPGVTSFADTAGTPNTWSLSGGAAIADYEVRQVAEISSLRPRWPGHGVSTAAQVQMTAQGISRRLRQGQKALDSSLIRLLRTYIDRGQVVAAWPWEEGERATQVAPLTANTDPIKLSGTYQLGGDTSWPAVRAAMTVNAGDSVFAEVDIPAIPIFTGMKWKVCRLMYIGTPETSPTTTRLLTVESSGRAAIWRILINDTNWTITATDDTGTVFVNDSNPTQPEMLNRWVFVVLDITDNGANVDYLSGIVYYDDVLNHGLDGTVLSFTNTGSFVGDTGRPTAFRNSLNAPPGGISAGCLFVSTGTAQPFAQAGAFAHFGELASARIPRLCNEGGVHVAVHSSNRDRSAILGFQYPDRSLIDHIEDAAATDGGLLTELRTETGFHYRCRDTFYNQDIRLDVDQGLVSGFEPAKDDAGRVNLAKVARRDGGFYEARDQADIDKRREYDDNPTLVLARDADLPSQASWRVHLGTPDGMRVPSLTVEIAKDDAVLRPAWIAVAPGDIVRGQNPPPWWPEAEVRQLIEGWTETISPELWTVEASTSPADLWEVLEEAVSRADTSGSVLNTAVNSSATSLAIATTGKWARWRSAAGGASFPIPILMAGEEMSVTDIDDIPFTFGAVGTATHADNTAVTPGSPAGVVAGNLIVILAAIRTTGTLATPTGYTRWPLFDSTENVALFAKIAASNGEAMPSIVPSGGSAGDTVSAQAARFGGTFHDPANLPVRWGRTAVTSAANIDYPATRVPYDNSLVLYIGWRADDWTSVASIAGATEIGEPSTTTGNDQGLVWDYLIQTTPADIATGSFTVTGGASAATNGGIIVLTPDVQTFTVTRSSNGVTKSQTAGTTVRLADQPVAAL